MVSWFGQLDRILRGEATRLPELQRGTVDVSVRGLGLVLIFLGMLYGLCMGSYALWRESGPVYDQFLATTVKVPALFVLTLLVTYPSLYVFNALIGSRLGPRALARLLTSAMAVNLAVLASLGPIVAFFGVTTSSYHFMILLNVLVFALSGVLGLSFLLQTLNRLSLRAAAPRMPPRPVGNGPSPVAGADANNPPPSDSANRDPNDRASAPYDIGPLQPIEGFLLGHHVKQVFMCWIVVFGLVGGQMSWVLRPFVGDPDKPFTWLRPRQGNFFEAVWHSARGLLG